MFPNDNENDTTTTMSYSNDTLRKNDNDGDFFEDATNATNVATEDNDGNMLPPPARRPRANAEDNIVTTSDNTHGNDDMTMNNTEQDEGRMKHVLVDANNALEKELDNTKTTIQRLFKELVEFEKVASDVHDNHWSTIQKSEHIEAERLNDLQAEVHGSVTTNAAQSMMDQ